MVRHGKRNPRRHQQALIEWFQNADSNQKLIHHIPHEIIEEILLRMPVKSLLKFKCVSKSWRFLISSPDFIKTHMQNSSKNATHSHHRVLSINHNRNRFACHIESFSLNSFLYNQVVDSMSLPWDLLDVVDSCNGLFCVISSNYHVFLWNPTTRKYRVLPDSVDYFYNFDSTCVYGIGFDESNYDYKIIKIMPPCLVDHLDHYSPSDSSRAKVYSLKIDSWKRIEDFPGHPTSTSSKFVNGKIHWPSFRSPRTEIVSLDMQTEVYEIIQLPFPHTGHIYLSLGSLEGCLSMLVTSYDLNCKNLWILKEYGVNESWTNVFNIPSVYPPYCQVPSLPLYMLNDGQILLLFGSTFVLYNPKDQSWRTRVVSNSCTYYGAYVYVESLVSPYAEDGPS